MLHLLLSRAARRGDPCSPHSRARMAPWACDHSVVAGLTPAYATAHPAASTRYLTDAGACAHLPRLKGKMTSKSHFRGDSGPGACAAAWTDPSQLSAYRSHPKQS